LQFSTTRRDTLVLQRRSQSVTSSSGTNPRSWISLNIFLSSAEIHSELRWSILLLTLGDIADWSLKLLRNGWPIHWSRLLIEPGEFFRQASKLTSPMNNWADSPMLACSPQAD